jgi:hypothetical protein
MKRNLDPENISADEDWVGNNAAFRCPACHGTFIVSGALHRAGRTCPTCGRAKGFVEGGKKSGGRAWIEWDGQ